MSQGKLRANQTNSYPQSYHLKVKKRERSRDPLYETNRCLKEAPLTEVSIKGPDLGYSVRSPRAKRVVDGFIQQISTSQATSMKVRLGGRGAGAAKGLIATPKLNPPSHFILQEVVN